MTATFLLVGHCMPDSWSLKRAIRKAVRDARVERVNDDAALAAPGSDTVLLVNRVLDGRFDTGNGIELIRRLTEATDDVIAILVSNLPDAQAEAVAAGARPGSIGAVDPAELEADRHRESMEPLFDGLKLDII